MDLSLDNTNISDNIYIKFDNITNNISITNLATEYI